MIGGRREGSVLLVVIGLLLLLMLVGFTFFTFASQEKVSAEYYADAAKQYEAGLDLDALWDFALEQLILGPEETNYQSVLWPGRHSLVPTAIGMFNSNGQGQVVPLDRFPFNGQGLNIATTGGPGPGAGQPFVDNDYNGAPDSDSAALLQFNISQYAAQSGWTRAQILGTAARPLGMPNFPSIDPSYTYPDANSVFLAHVGVVNGVPVYTPSFHRPQYLRNGGTPIPDWQTNPTTALKVLRPHPSHKNVADNATPRFLSNAVTIGTRTIQPFPFSVDDVVTNGISGEQGAWSAIGTAYNTVENDVDNDGDGVREGIWIDLNYPLQALPDGRTYVPLFSYTVIDADGLLNVNLHGNLAGLIEGSVPWGSGSINQLAGSAQSVSRSNMGVSPAEINPFWALTADARSNSYLSPPVSNGTPTSALEQYRATFGLSYSNPAQYILDRVSTANMDLMFLMSGRADYAVTVSAGTENRSFKDVLEGRWGERSLLLNAISQTSIGAYPRPGRTNSDDDGDRWNGLDFTPPPNSVDKFEREPKLGGFPIPAYGQPFDNIGSGWEIVQDPSQNNEIVANRPYVDLQSQTSFHTYDGYAGLGQYDKQSPAYATNPNVTGMIDEGDEVVADRRYQRQLGQFDQVFATDELAGLHLSQSDYSASLTSSRLRELLPFNLKLSIQASAIRKRFTTDSFDRKQHSFTYCNFPNGNTTPPGTPRGAWEFNANWSGTSTTEFPPQSPAMLLSPGAQQPFRAETAAVIGCQKDYVNAPSSVWNRQLRLNLNRLVALDNPNSLPGPGNAPFFRHLTPHPTPDRPVTQQYQNPLPLGNTPIPGSPGGPTLTPPPSAVNPAASLPMQEYWARIDRQKLARDLYVMLYMFGGAQDQDYSSTSNGSRTLYTNWQLREMAQFAVNYVDALDRDDVITKFEYDTDLSNGWGLDDNPYTIDASTDRMTVYGVEKQTLTLSEVLCIKAKNVPAGDNAYTLYNDLQGGDRTYLYFELRNASASPVDLSNGQWRIRLQRPANATLPDYSVIPLVNGRTGNATIDANSIFTIGTTARTDGDYDKYNPAMSASTNVARGSDFRIDTPGNGTFERIAPNVPDGGISATQANVPPGCKLDLVHDDDFGKSKFIIVRHDNQYPLSGPNPETGTDVSNIRGVMGGFMPYASYPGQGPTLGESLLVILERRANPYRASPTSPSDVNQNIDNPWVVVDVFQDTAGNVKPLTTELAIDSSTSAAAVKGALSNLTTYERKQPLDRSGMIRYSPPDSTYYLANSIGRPQNLSYNNTVYLWQPHFDRDFSSVTELFNVPLFGPEELTARLAYQGKLTSEWNYTSGQPAQAPFSSSQYQINFAGAKFMRPFNTTSTPHNNRWYRILELLEFPSRATQLVDKFNEIQGYGPVNRIPGRINLNGIRHPEVLLALLDDERLFRTEDLDNDGNLDPGEDANGNGILDFKTSDALESGRLWWDNLILARDGMDPYTGLSLPGAAGSRPFRDYSQVTSPVTVTAPATNVVSGNERTLIRRLPYDSEDLNDNGAVVPGADYNKDFSAANNTNPNAPRGLFEARTRADLTNNYVDPHTRHRLLAKVSNNTTNRSNVFIVWITVGYFDAYQPNAGMPNVVQIGAEIDPANRRKGFFVVDRTLLEDSYNAATGMFDFRKFVQYRKTVQ